MGSNKGFATIPVLVGLVLILAVVPLAINQVQKVQDVQRHAATESVCLGVGRTDCFQTPCCSGLTCDQHVCAGNDLAKVPCNELLLNQTKYCSAGSVKVNQTSIPCGEITAAVSKYCSN
jgi:hypothetical protein